MHLDGPYKYVLDFLPGFSLPTTIGDGVKTFIAPVTKKKSPKIYVFSSKRRVIYIGQTIQPIRDRIRQGVQADGSGGYYGYQCLREIGQVDIYIWLVKACPDDNASDHLECIEAEAVYLVRAISGQWPKCQNEIHFHNTKRRHRALAVELLEPYLL
ncbi:hypothetical protein ACFL3X_00945 [Gemmatimonadota bacterium]